MHKLTEEVAAALQQVIAEHQAELTKIPGFVTAEPGFRVADGWVQTEPAIVVYVMAKQPAGQILDEDRVPRMLGGYRTDVATASPERLLRASDEAALSETLALAADLTYQKRDGNPIDSEFSVSKPLLCHVGPDAGWPVLKRFLEGTRDTLSAAMYDLNAPWVAKTLIETVRDNAVKFTLTWDDGMTPEENAIRSDLKVRLAGRLDAWLVRCGSGRRFDSAYHEKVAVQDSRRFWISSGNWSKRSQPDIDPVAEPAQAQGMYGKGNREWHLVVDDEPLARLFEDYIRYDRDQSEVEDDSALADDRPQLPDLFVPIEALASDEEFALAAVDPVAPKRLPGHGRPFKIQPVLCPDNYIDRIDTLLRSATRSLYLQYSYITWTDRGEDAAFRALLEHVAELSYRDGFDLRIIVGNNDAEAKVRKLAENGFNPNAMRVQANIHNKGVIVDDEIVLVSSANWSSAGTLRNRDAGLIIRDPEVTRYFRDVFLDDWEARARNNFGAERPVRIARDGDPTPPGMVRMRWRDFHDE